MHPELRKGPLFYKTPPFSTFFLQKTPPSNFLPACLHSQLSRVHCYRRCHESKVNRSGDCTAHGYRRTLWPTTGRPSQLETSCL